MMTMPVAGDAELWVQVRRGDTQAFSRLFDRHADSVHNYCVYRNGSFQDAEDLTSTVFLEAWRSRERLWLDGPTALPLLFGIASHVCSHHRRSRGRAVRALPRLVGAGRDVEDDHADRVAGQVDAERQVRRVHQALERLSADHRAIVDLCLIGGSDIPTAAVALNVPEGTVKSRLSRARSQLRESLSDLPARPARSTQ